MSRIYLIVAKTVEGDDSPPARRLVRAANAARALRHVSDEFSVEVPTQDELMAAAAAGVKVEEAGADKGDALPTITT